VDLPLGRSCHSLRLTTHLHRVSRSRISQSVQGHHYFTLLYCHWMRWAPSDKIMSPVITEWPTFYVALLHFRNTSSWLHVLHLPFSLVFCSHCLISGMPQVLHPMPTEQAAGKQSDGTWNMVYSKLHWCCCCATRQCCYICGLFVHCSECCNVISHFRLEWTPSSCYIYFHFILTAAQIGLRSCWFPVQACSK